MFLLLLLLCFIPLQAVAVDAPAASHDVIDKPKIIITEIQTNGGFAAQEFIELYNTTDEAINLSPIATSSTTGGQWKLQFYGSSVLKDGVPVWQTAPTPYIFNLKGVIQPHDYFIVASVDHAQIHIDLPVEQVYTKSNPMTDSGGGVELIEVPGLSSATSPSVHDQIFWLDPLKTPTGVVLPSPAKLSSLQRQPNEDASYLNPDGSFQGFIEDSTITPLEAWVAPVVEVPVNPSPIDTNGDSDPLDVPVAVTPETVTDNTGLTAPYLTELLPNPGSPFKDETDEFIELYNPNPSPFNLKAYTLEVGTTTLHDFTFSDDLLVSAQSYLALYSKDTGLAMTNSGGQARLLDPHDVKLSETLPYTSADDGVAWELANDIWQWSTSATPGQPNVTTAPLATVKSPNSSSKTTPKKATAKTAAAKVKGTTKTKAKTATKSKIKKAKKPKVATVAQITAKPPRAPIHTGVLVAVVAAAVLYAAYEYRHDLSNRIHKLRSHRTIRAVAR